jgi:2-iminobutanoate/2-iminopropanoate deaminase
MPIRRPLQDGCLLASSLIRRFRNDFGPGPLDCNGVVVAGTIEEETTLALKNIRLHPEPACVRFDQIVKCGCFLADISDFDSFDRAYRRFRGDHFPCRTTVQAGLVGIKVEIEAIAYLGR